MGTLSKIGGGLYRILRGGFAVVGVATVISKLSNRIDKSESISLADADKEVLSKQSQSIAETFKSTTEAYDAPEETSEQKASAEKTSAQKADTSHQTHSDDPELAGYLNMPQSGGSEELLMS